MLLWSSILYSARTHARTPARTHARTQHIFLKCVHQQGLATLLSQDGFFYKSYKNYHSDVKTRDASSAAPSPSIPLLSTTFSCRALFCSPPGPHLRTLFALALGATLRICCARAGRAQLLWWEWGSHSTWTRALACQRHAGHALEMPDGMLF